MNPEELWLYTLCKKNGLSITDIQLKCLSSFKLLLLDWNKKINLVSRKNEEHLWKGHIALSLSMLFKLNFRPKMRILDIGTGGGLPGIPLAIMLPDCLFTLLDSTQKKITAVQSMTETLGLANVSTRWARAEDVHSTNEFSESFDAVVARSVSNLSNLLDWGLPFLKKMSGSTIDDDKITVSVPSLITFKGADIHGEQQSALIKYPNVRVRNVPLRFPGSEEFDHLDKQLLIVSRS